MFDIESAERLSELNKKYFDNGNTLNWGEDIPQDKVYALKQGEIFTLLDKDKKPFSKVLMDSYGITREKPLKIQYKNENDKICEGIPYTVREAREAARRHKNMDQYHKELML